MMKYFLKNSTGKDWDFYRAAVKKMFWNKIDKEYQEELAGIVEEHKGQKGKQYGCVCDLVGPEWKYRAGPSYYVPYLYQKGQAGFRR